jgi:hypothetical protein
VLITSNLDDTQATDNEKMWAPRSQRDKNKIYIKIKLINPSQLHFKSIRKVNGCPQSGYIYIVLKN